MMENVCVSADKSFIADIVEFCQIMETVNPNCVENTETERMANNHFLDRML